MGRRVDTPALHFSGGSMITTLGCKDEAPYCLDDNGEELSLEEQLRIEAEIAEEQKHLRGKMTWQR